MFTYTKENSYIYKFQTTKGSKYTIGFRAVSLDSAEIGIMRNVDEGDSVNTVYETMDTINSIINSYLKDHNLVNNLLFTVIGNDDDNIDKKSILFKRYIDKFKQDYPERSVIFNKI